MPWLMVNQIRLLRVKAVPAPVLALEVQRAEIPGQPGAYRSSLTGFILDFYKVRFRIVLEQLPGDECVDPRA